MKRYATVLTIAGSDCSGGAGIQADIKTISALGAYAASAITAITVQNTLGVTDIHPIPATFVEGQIISVLTDIRPNAVKIGMVNDIEIIHSIATCMHKYKPKHIIFDPVMVSSSGRRLIDENTFESLVKELIPETTLITPNLNEAEVLIGHPVTNINDMQRAAKELLKYGSQAVLVKGGHLQGGNMVDVLQVRQHESPFLFSAPQIESKNTHGTGCTLSSAIATYLALGENIEQAVKKAKNYLYEGLSAGKDIHIGEGHGPLNHFYQPEAMHIFDENE